MLDDPEHWILEPHLALLNDYIVRLVTHQLPTDNLLVSMHPRAGKSTFLCRYTPAWFLSVWPHLEVLLATYGDEFASQWGGKARDLIDDWGPKLFGIHTRDDSSAKHRWEIHEHGGGMQTAGIGGPLTGKGGHLKLIDDPVKDQQEAKSKVIQLRNWEWYRATFRTRSNPGAVTILLMCMVGATPVLMEDGSERPLRDLRPGDRIATYDAGKVAAASVSNWADQGPDQVYEIRMKSGIIVKANARHPFLVQTARGAKWQRTASLSKGTVLLRASSVMTATSSSAMGKQQSAYWPPLSTYVITGDTVLEVVEAGIENVFDIEVEGTANFIANGLVSHNTRWDKRDLAGMILAHEPEKWTVLNIPALAEEPDPEKGIGPDPLGRAPGEAMSRRFPRAALLDTRDTIGPYWWSSLYQGRPTVREGGKFKRERWRIVEKDTVPEDVKRVRKWDLAATSLEQGPDPDWTRGALISSHTSHDSTGKLRTRFWIEDLVSLRGETHEVQKLVMDTAESDGPHVRIHIDQDPGSAGKSVAVDYVSLLPGFSVITETVTGDKEMRSDVTAPKQAVGNLMIVRGDWNEELIEEHADFPDGEHDDIVDAVSGGVIYLAGTIKQTVTTGKIVDTRLRGRR